MTGDRPELVQILTTDLVAITRGRSVAADEIASWSVQGVGWVPANMALDPFDAIATPNPFGASGDLRLRPDMATQTRLEIAGRPPLHVVLADITQLDGAAWDCCPRDFLRRAIADLAQAGFSLVAAFEHEFSVLDAPWRLSACFSLAAHRRAEPFLTDLFTALRQVGAAPEVILPEYGAGQFEIACAPADALAAADRAVLLRAITHEIADAAGLAASFCPKTREDGVGNGVHIHFSLLDAAGEPASYNPAHPGGLSTAAGSFAAGILLHLPALCAIMAPSPVSYLRLVPQHWSSAFACLGERNREAALRICPLPATAKDPARSYNLEYRPADATANPYLALGALIRAGLAGLHQRLDAPSLVNNDPADMTDAERGAVGAIRLPETLGAALAALHADDAVSGWFSADFLSTFTAVKTQEITAAAELTPDELCRRYRAVY